MVSLGFTCFYLDFYSFTGSFCLLVSLTMFYRALLGFTRFLWAYCILLLYCVRLYFLCYIGFYWVLPCCTLCLTGFSLGFTIFLTRFTVCNPFCELYRVLFRGAGARSYFRNGSFFCSRPSWTSCSRSRWANRSGRASSWTTTSTCCSATIPTSARRPSRPCNVPWRFCALCRFWFYQISFRSNVFFLWLRQLVFE